MYELLEKGNFYKDCRQDNCKKYGSKHNTLLYRINQTEPNALPDREMKTSNLKKSVNFSAFLKSFYPPLASR